MTITIQEHNATTGEIEVRSASAAEAKAIEAAELASNERIANEATKAEAKAALLARLGITEEEAQLLLG